MLNIYKKAIFSVVLFSIVSLSGHMKVSAVAGPVPTDGISNGEVKDNLSTDFNRIIGDNVSGDLEIEGALNGKTYGITLSNYDDLGLVYYGNPSVVTPATGQKNDIKGLDSRFFGLTSDGLTPMTNFRFTDDIPTDGDVAGRNYMYGPWEDSKRYALTYAYRPGEGIYNDEASVAKMVTLQLIQNGEYDRGDRVDSYDVIDYWLEGIYDKYQRDHAHWRSTSSYFKRTSTSDQFKPMSKSMLRRINYIAMPPTEYTVGFANNFYTCGSASASGYCYDVFWVNQFTSPEREQILPDFKADELQIAKKNVLFYDVRLKGTLTKESVKNNPVKSYSRYRIGNGSWQNVDSPLIDSRHGNTWMKNSSKTELMGSIFIPPNTPEGTLVEVVAEINPRSGVTSGKRGIDEDNVADNKTRITFRTEKIPMCVTGGDGTTKKYEIKRLGSSKYDPNTKTSTTTSYCEKHTRRINNLATAEYDDKKHTLMGVWSKNTSSHSEKADINAMGSVPSKEEFNVKLTGPFVEKLNKLGIKNPKRTIRAGRSVQLYGTIEMELNLRSFDGSADLEAKKNAFLKEVENTIETKGIDVNKSKSEDVVKNNAGKTRVKAQFDKTRKMTTSVGALSTTKFGDASCLQITEYARTYKIVIPVKSLSSGGTQKTNQSTFIDEKAYAVKDKTADFVTGINTKNGLYGVANSFKLDASKMDSGLSNTMWCTSEEEVFRVKGNIFDDVRTEDESDKTDKKSGDWDF